MILWSHNAFLRRCSTQYFLFVVKGQTTISAFHKVVQQQY